MNATLRISVFSQNANAASDVELVIRGIDSADVPAECFGSLIAWHDAICVSYDADDRTLTIAKPADARCKDFDALTGTEIAAQRHNLATSSRSNKDVLIREVEIAVSTKTIDAILARASGYVNDMFDDPFGNNDALGKLMGLVPTDFGAADLFTDAFPSEYTSTPNGTAALV